MDKRLSTLAVSVRQIKASLIRADRLRQSFLKQAFEGKLVPQDPTDELSSVLLEWLRATRGTIEKTKKPERKEKKHIHHDHN